MMNIEEVWFELLHYYYRVHTKFRNRRPELRIVARHRATYYAEMWEKAARHLDADIRPLGGEFYEIRKSNKVMRVWQAETTLSSSVDHLLTGNKPLVAGILSAISAPIPRYRIFSRQTLPRAEEFLEEIGGPVVVKPSDRTGGGNSVVTNITNRAGIVRAAANARVWGRDILIEEQIRGKNYRLLYLDGELVDCVLRKPPTLRGDGVSSLAELVTKENEVRLTKGSETAQVLLSIDMDMQNTLAAQRLTLSSVPREGQDVVMKEVINQNRREDDQPASHELCAPIAQLGREIVRAIGARVVGIDVITENPRVPLDESGGIILEVNSPPGLYYHNRRTEDGAHAIAVEILRRGLS